MHRQHRITTVLSLIPFVAGSLGATPQDQSLTIKTSTQEVVLDVVVRDSHGKLVKGLAQKDFQVIEDGAPQQITSFHFVQGRDALQTQQASTGSRTPSAAAANPLRAVNLVCIVYQNLDPYTKKDAIAASREFLTNHFSPDTWIAVYNLTDNLSALHPFTTNRAELLRAADRAFTGTTMDFVSSATEVLNATPNVDYTANGPVNTGHGSVIIAGPGKVSGGELNTLVNNDASSSNDEAANRQRGDLAGQRRQFGGVEAQRQTDQILNLISKLGTLPGRKSVLLVSPGLPSNGDEDLFKSVLAKANKADITFYGLDVHGLTENSNVGAANNAVGHVASLSKSQANAPNGTGSAGVAMEQMRQDDYLVQAVRGSDSQSALRALSEGTGGFLIASTNDYRKPFQKLVEDVETHYEVIYHPGEEKMDGHLRSVSVKMDRPDLVAESRNGYYALPMLGGSSDLAPYEMAGLAALNFKTPPHAFDFRSAAYHFRPGASNSQGELSFELPVSGMTATPEPQAKRHQLHAAVFALIKDASGQVVEKFSRDSPYEIPDENLSSAAKSNILFSHPVTLAPGHYTMDVAALDRESGRASTSKLAFDVPPAKGVGISSIALVQRVDAVKGKVDGNEPFEFQPATGEGRRVTPELSDHLMSDARPSVYFVVYPDPAISDKAKIQVEFRVGGQTLAKQTADLPAPDASGAVPMLIKTATEPGNCELRITAVQGASQSQEKLDYTIAAK